MLPHPQSLSSYGRAAHRSPAPCTLHLSSSAQTVAAFGNAWHPGAPGQLFVCLFSPVYLKCHPFWNSSGWIRLSYGASHIVLRLNTIFSAGQKAIKDCVLFICTCWRSGNNLTGTSPTPEGFEEVREDYS